MRASVTDNSVRHALCPDGRRRYVRLQSKFDPSLANSGMVKYKGQSVTGLAVWQNGDVIFCPSCKTGTQDAFRRQRRVDFLLVIARLCADYHSGMNSRGYRILSLAFRLLREHYKVTRPLDVRLSAEQRELYRKLAQRYGEKL